MNSYKLRGSHLFGANVQNINYLYVFMYAYDILV